MSGEGHESYISVEHSGDVFAKKRDAAVNQVIAEVKLKLLMVKRKRGEPARQLSPARQGLTAKEGQGVAPESERYEACVFEVQRRAMASPSCIAASMHVCSMLSQVGRRRLSGGCGSEACPWSAWARQVEAQGERHEG